MNPIDIDSDELCKYIGLSEIYPAKILQQIITEYCTLKGETIEDILRNEKHELYHKRIKTELCCVCRDNQFCTYIKVIQEKQWETLYEMKEDADSHSCQSNIQKCCERFIPKKIDTCDLSVTVPLVLYIPDILTHITNRLYTNKFDTFLMNNKHALYHSMTTERCCSCNSVPTGKTILSKQEWNKIFKKTDVLARQTCTKDCCCQFSVINGIKSSDIDENVLSKICHVVGPISVLNKIAQDSFLYFLNWISDNRPLSDALTELLNIIEDKTLYREVSKHVSTCNFSQWDKTITKEVDVHKWVSTHIKLEQTTPEPSLQFLLLNKGKLCTLLYQVKRNQRKKSKR
ncbi:unnamed protein product [Mytilus coruscus]|uniref:DZIP3-like HEPN domain-containing protein n=1 Tax=Mytilus coruscus TaxID=42192 RepID=A0A6J8EY78_MYTCO|nr:unnamed protein product [Mytilus coruscus]